jgi:glycosyltransferase involved in cell wall biosynthesis
VKKLISVVAGCFNEEGNIDELYQRVRAVFEQLPQYHWEMIFIDNASTDGTRGRLRTLAAADPQVKVIFNARNFGHVRSPYYALTQARGDAVISLASDLQDPPEMIPQFLAKWEEGYQAVVGAKDSSAEAPLFFFVRRCYYRLVHRLADVEIIQNCTGFGLYDQRIIELCRGLDDPYPYFRGLISEFGLPTARISYRQPVRTRGLTKNNFYTLYDIAMLGLTNHSKVPLRLATMLGFALAFCSLLVAVFYLVFKLVFWYNFPIGIAPVVIGLFLFCSIQLFFIGVLGEYIGAIHTQVLKRPLVVEAERLNFDVPAATCETGEHVVPMAGRPRLQRHSEPAFAPREKVA